MKLTVPCISCNTDIRVPQYAKDRIGIAMKKGDNLELRCHECGKQSKYHLNDVRASKSKYLLPIMLSISVVMAIAGTVILWDFGWVASATISVPFMMWFATISSEEKNISGFNLHRISDKNRIQE